MDFFPDRPARNGQSFIGSFDSHMTCGFFFDLNSGAAALARPRIGDMPFIHIWTRSEPIDRTVDSQYDRKEVNLFAGHRQADDRIGAGFAAAVQSATLRLLPTVQGLALLRVFRQTESMHTHDQRYIPAVSAMIVHEPSRSGPRASHTRGQRGRRPSR